MSAADMLPREWVERIFTKLQIRYGRAFMARWDGIDIDAVKADWAHELAGLRSRPDLIVYALDNLPSDRPPTVGQLRELANSRPAERDPAPALLDYKRGPIPAAVMRALDALKEPREVDRQYAGPKGWAYRLRDQEASGATLSGTQRRFWREALSNDMAGGAE